MGYGPWGHKELDTTDRLCGSGVYVLKVETKVKQDLEIFVILQ